MKTSVYNEYVICLNNFVSPIFYATPKGKFNKRLLRMLPAWKVLMCWIFTIDIGFLWSTFSLIVDDISPHPHPQV